MAMRFGNHLSMSGRLADAPERGRAIGCRAMQIFSGNPRGWDKAPLDPERVAEFHSAVAKARIDPVVVHATYLINLAAPDDDIYEKSVAAFIDEIRRAATLGARFYVVHCGSHKGQGEAQGRGRIVQALERAAGEVDLHNGPTILLENTAGTNNSLGTTFEDLAALLDSARVAQLGVCFDTCHALAAGYEIRTLAGVKETFDQFERALGMARLRCLHINDSKGDLSSHLDRHEHIGQGAIGNQGFRNFFSDRRLWNLPAILETPVDSPDDDRIDLWHTVELAVAAGAVPQEWMAFMPTAPVAHEPIGARKAPKRRAPAKAPAKKKVLARKAAAGKKRVAKKKAARRRR